MHPLSGIPSLAARTCWRESKRIAPGNSFAYSSAAIADPSLIFERKERKWKAEKKNQQIVLVESGIFSRNLHFFFTSYSEGHLSGGCAVRVIAEANNRAASLLQLQLLQYPMARGPSWYFLCENEAERKRAREEPFTSNIAAEITESWRCWWILSNLVWISHLVMRFFPLLLLLPFYS